MTVAPNIIFQTTYYSFFLSVINCPTLTSVPGATLDFNNGTRLDAIASYSCDSGLRFWDGTTSKTIWCLVTEDWSETNLDCTGKDLFFFYAINH